MNIGHNNYEESSCNGIVNKSCSMIETSLKLITLSNIIELSRQW